MYTSSPAGSFASCPTEKSSCCRRPTARAGSTSTDSVPKPVPRIDVETSNWFTSTHPRSPFVTGLIVTSHRPDGTRLSLSNWTELAFVTQTPSGSSTSPVELESVPGLLESEFGLPGFSLSGEGRIVRD